MQNPLDSPLFQSSVAPFATGMLVALLLGLHPRARFLQGLAVMAGLAVTAGLSLGLEFEPLTSTRKILLCSLILPWVGLAFATGRVSALVEAVVLALLLFAAALWVAAPVLGRADGWVLVAVAARVGLFAAATGALLVWFGRRDSLRQGSAALALAVNLGLAALIAASALYGQLALGTAAALAGVLAARLLVWRRWPAVQRASLGSLAVFAAAVPLGLVGGAATVYARLPSLALPFLLLAPVVVALPLARDWRPLPRLALLSLLALLASAPAVVIAWYSAGAVGF